MQQALHGSDERWQVHLDRRLDDRVGRVEVPVGEVVPHPSHVSPRDLGLGGEQPGVDVLHCLADLDEPHADGVEDEAIAEAAPLEVGSDRCRPAVRCPAGSQWNGLPEDQRSHAGLQRVGGYDVDIDPQELA